MSYSDELGHILAANTGEMMNRLHKLEEERVTYTPGRMCGVGQRQPIVIDEGTTRNIGNKHRTTIERCNDTI